MNRRARIFSVLVLPLLLLLPLDLYAKAKIEKQSFISSNKKRSFYLFVPENLTAEERVPLLLVFHGSGRNGLSLVEKWTDLAAKERFIVGGLDSLESSHWSTAADNPGVVRDLVEMLESKYSIDRRRVYLFGHSAGAVFAIDLSMIESEYFAATAVHAGAWRAKDEFEMIKSARRKIPLAIWVGSRDPFFSIADVRATRDALIANGFAVAVTEIPGHDHFYYDLAPKINESAWKFLKQHRLPSEPHYVDFVEADEAASANKLIAEINSLQPRIMELVKNANVLDLQIARKDRVQDRVELEKLVREQSASLKEAANTAQAAAQTAERAAQLKIGERNRAYLRASAEYYWKFVELLDAKREEAEVPLAADSPEVIRRRHDDARKKVENLQREVDELRIQTEKALPQ